jgi:hypothetical protein
MLFMISYISRKSNALFFLHSHLEAQEAFGIYSFAQVATVSRAAWINDYARIRNCQHHKFKGAVANQANIMALLNMMFDSATHSRSPKNFISYKNHRKCKNWRRNRFWRLCKITHSQLGYHNSPLNSRVACRHYV